jgi:hypothetical protein
MQKPPLDPDVADAAPADSMLTPYDHEHMVTYLRLLDANAEGTDWQEVARIVLHIDPRRESARARKAFDSHLSRAKWMSDRLQASATWWCAGLAWHVSGLRAARLLVEPRGLRLPHPASSARAALYRLGQSEFTSTSAHAA